MIGGGSFIYKLTLLMVLSIDSKDSSSRCIFLLLRCNFIRVY
jgi:hypothetical protein